MSYGEQLDDRLAKMRFVAEAAGQNLERESVSADADRSPKFNGLSLYDEAVRLVDDLFEELDRNYHRAQHSPPPSATPEQYRKYIVERYEGEDMEFVAQSERVSVYFVRQVRKEAGKSEKSGKSKGFAQDKTGQK